jgi:hypothetical protein
VNKTHMLTGAQFSADQLHRYTLERVWDQHLKHVAIIGLNPSTADAFKDDPTIRRVTGFAHAWGYGGFTMLNLFTYRTSQPKELAKARRADGLLARYVLVRELTRADVAVCAWGDIPRRYYERARWVAALAQSCGHLTVFRIGPPTRKGHPRHPLYLKKDLLLETVEPGTLP